MIQHCAASFALPTSPLQLRRAVRAAALDPAIATYILSRHQVGRNAAAQQTAVLYGDRPSGTLHRASEMAGRQYEPPAFPPNDRLIVVLQGTWWVGTGDKYDPDNTVPVRPQLRHAFAARSTTTAPRART